LGRGGGFDRVGAFGAWAFLGGGGGGLGAARTGALEASSGGGGKSEDIEYLSSITSTRWSRLPGGGAGWRPVLLVVSTTGGVLDDQVDRDIDPIEPPVGNEESIVSPREAGLKPTEERIVADISEISLSLPSEITLKAFILG